MRISSVQKAWKPHLLILSSQASSHLLGLGCLAVTSLRYRLQGFHTYSSWISVQRRAAFALPFISGPSVSWGSSRTGDSPAKTPVTCYREYRTSGKHALALQCSSPRRSPSTLPHNCVRLFSRPSTVPWLRLANRQRSDCQHSRLEGMASAASATQMPACSKHDEMPGVTTRSKSFTVGNVLLLLGQSRFSALLRSAVRLSTLKTRLQRTFPC